MGRVTAEADWLREIGELVAVSGGHAQETALALIKLAQHHAIVCGGATCQLRDIPGGPEACVLALELSTLASGLGMEIAPGQNGRPGEIADAYLASLGTVSAAVQHCRKVEHASGRCWFLNPATGQDLCGRILSVSHAVALR